MPPAAETGALLKMVEDGTISLNAAKTAFAAMCKSGKGAERPSANWAWCRFPMKGRSRQLATR